MKQMKLTLAATWAKPPIRMTGKTEFIFLALIVSIASANAAGEVSPIPEMLDLSNHAVSVKTFEQHDSRQIAENLILRIQEEEAKDAKPSNPVYDFYKDTSIKMFLPQRYLGGILEQGFLNAWQVHHGNQWILEDVLIDLTFPHICCEEAPFPVYPRTAVA
jgi:hypothetical protein